MVGTAIYYRYFSENILHIAWFDQMSLLSSIKVSTKQQTIFSVFGKIYTTNCYEPMNKINYLLMCALVRCGKGSVSWWLNTTNVNTMINVNIGIKRTSSHETSHTRMSEICEFQVHYTPPRLIKWIILFLQSKMISNWTKNISF